MEFKKYENPKEFIEENEKLILEKEWLNNLMAGNLKDAEKNGIDENWMLARITHEGKTELIMLSRKPWKLVLYSPTDNKSEELYKFAARETYKVNPSLHGVNTEKEIAEKFAKYFCKIANKNYKVCHEMRILLLENLLEANLRNDVIFRKAEVKDKETLISFSKEFHKEALQEDISYEVLEERFYNHLEKGYFVLEKDGKIVAQTVSTRDLERGKSVSGVFVPKDERCKGYAYNLVYRVSKYFLENGAEYCVLFTDDTNPISNHVYEKIGYVRMADTTDFDFI